MAGEQGEERARRGVSRRGGNTCYSPTGDNRHHAIIGGNRSFIVHDSDLGPALVALGANITLARARGTRTLALEVFDICRRRT